MIVPPVYLLGSLIFLEIINHVVAILSWNLTVIPLNGNALVCARDVGFYLKCVIRTDC